MKSKEKITRISPQEALCIDCKKIVSNFETLDSASLSENDLAKLEASFEKDYEEHMRLAHQMIR
ncbi:MAG: hypothetical protein ACYCQJ_06070 [Nitrososphaerales archaeon]